MKPLPFVTAEEWKPIPGFEGLCYEAKSGAFQQHSQAETDAALDEAEVCGFLEAWVGYCLVTGPCEKHRSQKCWSCGGKATANCSATGGLVCGVPFCRNHPHEETHGRGLFG